MSGPYRPGYPGNGNQPVSFKTDINRQKTKKWVAAKSYSYDGDDWGDDDDNEEIDEEEEAPHVPSSTAPDVPPVAHQAETPLNPIAESQQSPAFVRPADIYKRMQEDKGRQPQDSTNTAPSETTSQPGPTSPVTQNISQNAPLQTSRENNGRPTSPLVIPEVKRLSGFGQDFFGDANTPQQPSQPSQVPASQVADQGSSLHQVPSLGFNSVVHQAFDVVETPSSATGNFSRSNSDSTSVISPIINSWKSETDKTPTIAEEPAVEASAQEPPADFKPGHRRDLSIPSPGNGPDRVPVVANAGEGQSAEIVASPQDSLDTSESYNNDSIASPNQLESGEATPRPLSHVNETVDRTELESTSTNSELESTDNETHPRGPTPLRISNEDHPDAPQSIPSLSTETSPQDMESDRLRKEIMRSFSGDYTFAADPADQAKKSELDEPKVRPQHESTYLPSEYDSYWGDEGGIPPTNPLQPRSPVPPAEPLNLVINPAPAPAPAQNPPSEPRSNQAASKSRPKLKKRFSWEAADASDEDILEEPSAPAQQPLQSPPAGNSIPETADKLPTFESILSAPETALGNEAELANRQTVPEYPAAEKEVIEHLEQEIQAPQVGLDHVSPVPEPEPESEPIAEKDVGSLPSQSQPRPSVNEASLPTFRKILEISSSSEKIRVFNDTREQFAAMDTGLLDWIRRSSESLPEHADLIQANGRLPGGAPTSGLPPKTKFPKLSSFGNLSLPSGSSHGPDVSSSSGFTPTHARRSSGSNIAGVMNRQNVESRGKDLLHSAGVLGGRAGGAARGLFTKGKNKLRGADKGMISIFRGQRHRSWILSSDSIAQSEDLEFDKRPVSLSASSRYSLQPVPRIPSLRLGNSKSFRDSFDGEEVFSTHGRSFSADFGHNLKTVTEEGDIAFKPNEMTFLRPATIMFDSDINIGSLLVENSENGGLKKNPSPFDTFLDSARSSHCALNDVAQEDALPNKSLVRASISTQKGSTDPVARATENDGPSSDGNIHTEVQVPTSNEGRDSRSERISSNPVTNSTILSNPDMVSSVDETLHSPVSPPYTQDENTVPTEYTDRRDSTNSEVSDMSQDEMNRIREKFDEEGLYSEPNAPSPTRSQISKLSADADDLEDDAIAEKLDEEGLYSDPEKDTWEEFPQPPPTSTAPQNQPIRVVKMSRFSTDRKTSQNSDTDTSRYSKFSFESESNALAEERLVRKTGGRPLRHTDATRGVERLTLSQVPATVVENALEKSSPPIPNSETPYGGDRKEPITEKTSALNSPSLESDGARSPPPRYQSIGSPLPQLDAIWKAGRLQDVRTNRGSIASSSVSSMSNPNANSTSPRMISPEPPTGGPYAHNRMSSENKEPKQSPQSDKPLLTNKRVSDGRYPLTSPEGSGVASDGSLSSPGRRDEDSLGSGDSMMVQAALSRHDLRMEPSPLNQNIETTSDHAKVPLQFRNRIKFMGKRTSKGPAANFLPAETEDRTKLVEKKTERKADGKKGGAFSRIGGIFNRSNPNQYPEQDGQHVGRNTPSPHGFQKNDSSWGNEDISSHNPRPHSIPTHVKVPYPPPKGYYAPAQDNPTYDAGANYPTQNYSQDSNNPTNTYQTAPATQYSQNDSFDPQEYGNYYSPPVKYNYASPPVNRSQSSSASPEVEHSRSRARDLRMRSRSPRPSPVRAANLKRSETVNVNYADPIYHLGKFHVVAETPRIGDQSRPFPITLPEDLANGQISPRNTVYSESLARAQDNRNRHTVQPGMRYQPQRPTGLMTSETPGYSVRTTAPDHLQHPALINAPAPMPPPTSEAPRQSVNPDSDSDGKRPVVAKNSSPIELPVPNENSEEIVMSSTAYPGQEWQPDGFEQWMPY